jgi:hypothetical protein
VLGGTVVSPAEDGRHPAVVLVLAAAWGASALLLVWGVLLDLTAWCSWRE